MLIPQEFKDLCAQFHQDAFVEYHTFGDAIAGAVGALRKDEREVVRKFLARILSPRYDDSELKRAWRMTPAQIHFPGTKGVRTLRHN